MSIGGNADEKLRLLVVAGKGDAPRPQIWFIYLSEGCALDGDEVIYLIGEELGRGNSCIFQ